MGLKTWINGPLAFFSMLPVILICFVNTIKILSEAVKVIHLVFMLQSEKAP